MTFEEQAAELTRLEAVAKSLGLSEVAFERITLDVVGQARGRSTERTPEQVLTEIRRRIYAPLMEKPAAAEAGRMR